MYRVAKLCAVLGVSRSGYYKWTQRKESKREKRRRVTDITYIATDEGWLYLSSVMDLYSRKIVGFQMGERMTKELVIQALDRAFNQQRPSGEVLHHSDRGSQYASHDYQAQLV